MQTKKLNFFEQIYYATIRPNQYYRLTKVSGGRLTGFIFLFIFLISLFSIIPLFIETFGSHGISQMLNEIPDFELSGGQLYVEERYELDEGGSYILIDTSINRFTDEDVPDGYYQCLLISRTNMINAKSYGRTQEVRFSDIPGLHFDNDNLASLLPFFYLIIIIAAVFVYLYLLAIYLLGALIYSLVGLFVNYLGHVKLTYAAIFKTAIYSKVTIRILYSIIDYFGLSLNGYFRGLIAILATCAYVAFGILSHSSEEAHRGAGIPGGY